MKGILRSLGILWAVLACACVMVAGCYAVGGRNHEGVKLTTAQIQAFRGMDPQTAEKVIAGMSSETEFSSADFWEKVRRRMGAKKEIDAKGNVKESFHSETEHQGDAELTTATGHAFAEVIGAGADAAQKVRNPLPIGGASAATTHEAGTPPDPAGPAGPAVTLLDPPSVHMQIALQVSRDRAYAPAAGSYQVATQSDCDLHRAAKMPLETFLKLAPAGWKEDPEFQRRNAANVVAPMKFP